MRIADATKRIETLPLETKIDVPEVPPEAAAAIRAAQAAKNFSAGAAPVRGAVTASKSPFGGAVQVRTYGEILPVLDPTNAFTSAVREAGEKPSAGTTLEALGAFAGLAETGTNPIPGSGPRLIGGVCDLFRFVRARKKKQPGADFEVTLASLQLIARAVLSIADLAGSAHAKSVAEGFGWLVDMGDKMFVLSHDEARGLASRSNVRL